MAKEKTKKEIIKENLQNEISKIDNKESKFYFFALDTKGKPNSELTYMYETALSLKELGYKVEILHSEKDFVGVGGWLGEEYSKLPHSNIETDGVRISPSDILIIPEIFSNVMYQTKNLPCKRIVLLHNLDYITEVIQPGTSWFDYALNECVTSSAMMEDKIKELFKGIDTSVVVPYIHDRFKESTDTPKKLIVNIVTKERSIVNRIVKEFFWKYPAYKWVAFRHIVDLPRNEFADVLKEAAITVWVDENTSFGYSALEAIAAGNIVIAKVPEDACDWALDNDFQLKDNAVWFYNMSQVHGLIAKVVEMFIHDDIPTALFENMEDTTKEYCNKEKFNNNVKAVYVEKILASRKDELVQLLSLADQNV